MFSVALLLLLAAGSYVKCEQLTQPASVTVQPGQRLTITCQVSYSLSSYFTGWIRQPAGKGLEWIGMKYTGGSYYKDSLKNKFSIDLDSSSKTVTLNGQNVQPEDTAVYYCARAGVSSGSWGPYDYWGKGTMVTITAATPTRPTLFPLVQCGSGTGGMFTLGCLATGFTPSSLTYAWDENGADLPEFIQYPPVKNGNLYTGVSQIQVKKQDWDAYQTFHCDVTHVAGNGRVTFVRQKVPYQLPTLSVLASSVEEHEASFSCLAKDFSPIEYEIKWLKNEVEIHEQIYDQKKPIAETDYGNGTVLYTAGSFLTVKSSELPRNTKLTCEFKGKNDNGEAFINSSLIYHPDGPCPSGCPEADVDVKIEGPTMEDILVHRKGYLKCHVKINKPSVEKIFWENQDGNEMAGASLTPHKGSTATFIVPLEITYEEWSQGIKRYCVVEHSDWFEPLKTLYERNTGGQTEHPSVFMQPPIEQTRKEKVTLTCYVKDFFPKDVYVSWLVDDQPADSQYEFSTTDPIENEGLYSVYSQLTLSLDQWKNDDMVYSCVVYHQSVVNNCKTIVRSIGYRSHQQTNLVNLNMNIPETCKA